MLVSLHLVLLSGREVTVSSEHSATVASLRLKAQEELKICVNSFLKP